MKRTRFVAIGVITMAVACASGGEKHDMAADVAAIGKVRDGYVAAFKSGNAAAIGALFTADGHSMGNAQPTALGAQGVEAAMKGMMGQMSGQDIAITPDKTDVSGDMAYDRGSYKTTMTPKGGPPMVEEGRYLVVLKRQADGSWKLVEEMGNLPTAPAPAPAPPKARGKK